MHSEELTRFIHEVIRSHELATGLKPLSSHQEIIAYGQNQGFDFSEAQWNACYEGEFSNLSVSIQQKVLSADPEHWSWAFRQLTAWRAMLMEGADN